MGRALLQFFDFFSHGSEQLGGQFGITFLGGELLAIRVDPIQQIA